MQKRKALTLPIDSFPTLKLLTSASTRSFCFITFRRGSIYSTALTTTVLYSTVADITVSEEWGAQQSHSSHSSAFLGVCGRNTLILHPSKLKLTYLVCPFLVLQPELGGVLFSLLGVCILVLGRSICGCSFAWGAAVFSNWLFELHLCTVVGIL